MTLHRTLGTFTVLILALHPPALGQSATRFTVAEAVARGLENHPRLGVARADASAARAALGVARSEWLPSIQVAATGTRFQKPMIISPLHAFDPTAPPEFHRTLVQSEWFLAYSLFDGGGRGARVAREDAAYRAQQSARDEVEAEVVGRIVTAYLEVVTAAQIDSAQAARVRALESELTRANQLFEEGRSARIDVLRARAGLAGARADHVATSSAYRTARAQLARETGVPDSLPGNATVGTVSEASAPAECAELSAMASAHSPIIERTRHQLAAREAGVRVARAAWFPSLDLRGGVATYGSVDGNFSAEWRGALSVSYPIFTGGARGNAVGRANAQADAANAAVRSAELDVAHNVDRAFATWEEQAAQREALEEVVIHLRDVVRIEQLALEVGTGVQTDYLQAEAALFEARAGLARARSGVIRSRLLLARLTGQLTLEWVTENLETES